VHVTTSSGTNVDTICHHLTFGVSSSVHFILLCLRCTCCIIASCCMQEVYKNTSLHDAAKEHVMVQYYSLSTPIYFNTIEINILYNNIIVSTNCFRFLHSHAELSTNCTTQTAVNDANGKVIVLRLFFVTITVTT
jgi:hypothetical protein